MLKHIRVRTVLLVVLLCTTLSLFISVRRGQSSATPPGVGSTSVSFVPASLGGVAQTGTLSGSLYFPQVGVNVDSSTSAQDLENLQRAADELTTSEESVIAETTQALEQKQESNETLAALGLNEGDVLLMEEEGSFVPGLTFAALTGTGVLLAALNIDSGGEGAGAGSGSGGGNSTSNLNSPPGGGGSGGSGAEGGSGSSGVTGGGDDGRSIPSTPEPSSMVLMGAGLAWLLKRRFQRA